MMIIYDELEGMGEGRSSCGFFLDRNRKDMKISLSYFLWYAQDSNQVLLIQIRLLATVLICSVCR
jgi:hypothetical protein